MNIETWRCTVCGGEDAPCIVQIYFKEGKYGPLKDNSRFRRRPCVCDNSPSPDWIKVDNPAAQADGPPR